jgi:hypothetical protein
MGMTQQGLLKRKNKSLSLLKGLGICFLEIPEQYMGERKDMERKIHEVQRMIISRPGFRINREMLNHEK